ncbi:MAG TPA: hypothetical protein VEV62_02770 [Parafilimonas sp.]|nr:hypothetical protein [Parafilimonas sp.]
MKKRLIFCFFIVSCTINVHAQQSNNDSLRAKIDTLEKKLEENNYTRIPNKDFDNILAIKVNERVSDEIQGIIKWITLIEGVIILILGFLAKYYFNDIIRKELATASETLENKLATASLKLEENIKTSIDKKLNDTVGVIWEDGASNLIRKAKDAGYKDETIINNLSHYLETENLKLDDEVKLDLIAALVKCYFFSKKKDKLERLIQIINKYENEKLKLRPETYADAAIVFCDNYEYYGTTNYYNATIDYCDKSINVLVDYGIPYAVKFETFMINYKKAYDKTESAAALENINKLFKAVSNNQSDILCVETLTRFLVDKKFYMKEYVEELEKQFAVPLKEMKQRAFNNLSKNPPDVNDTNTNDLFDLLKAEGFVAV